MRHFCFTLLLLWAFAPGGFAQTHPQPTMPFPFELSFLTADSTPIASTAVFKTGKPTVLAFWLTTCPPCQIEFDSYARNLAGWQAETDFNFVAVSIDFPSNFRRIGKMVGEKKWPFPIYWDRTRSFKNILPGGLNGLPQVFLFDKDGLLVWQHKGYRPGDEAELLAKVKEAK